jgi:hypothetical protein
MNKREWKNVALATALMLSGCGEVTGEDVRTYDVREFSILKLSDHIDATVEVCDDCPFTVELTGDADSFDKYEVEVEDDELVVRRKPAFVALRNYAVDVVVQARSLHRLELDGGGKCTVTGLETSHFELETDSRADISIEEPRIDDFHARLRGHTSLDVRDLQGTTVELNVRRGDVVMSGSVEEVELKSTGNRDVADLTDLEADAVELTLDGGDFEVCANEKLNVSIRGSAEVRYACDPDAVQAEGGDGGSVLPL